MAIKSLMKVKLQLLAFLLVLVIPSTVLASTITGADYTGTITVTNNGTATSNVSTIMTLSSASLINNFGVASDFSDVVIRNDSGADVAFQPSVNSSYPWVLWDASIAANSAQTMNIYLKDVSGGKLRWFPGTSGGSVVDSASLELGDNFSIEWKGRVDTTAGASKNLVSKQNAISVYVDPVTSGTINALIQGSATSWTLATSNDNPATWSTEALGYDNNTGTKASSDAVPGTSWGGYCTFTMTSTFYTESIKFYAQWRGAGHLLDVDVYNTENSTWLNIFSGVFTDATWETKTFTNMETNKVRVRFYNPTGGALNYDLYEIQVNNNGSAVVSATGVASGEHTVNTTGVQNNPAWATGNTMAFDGTVNGYLNCGDIAAYDTKTKYAVSLWFKPTAAHNAGSGNHAIYAKGNAAATIFTIIWLTNDGKLSWYVDNGGAGDLTLSSTQTSWVAGVWHHVVAGVNDVSGAFMIIDGGVPITSADTRGTGNAGVFTIGHYDNVGSLATAGFVGQVQNVCTFTDTLTTEEKAGLYLGIVPADAIDYWYIDEGTGDSVYSYGTGANTGTKAAGATWGTSTHTTGSTGRLCDFYISVDSVAYQGMNLKTVDVPDNANPLYFCQNNVMPYVESIKVYAGGVLAGSWAWQYLTSWIDASGNGNTMTPTFRTTSSDADVSASLTSLQPVTVAASTASPSTSWPNVIAAAPPQQSTMYTDNSTTAGYPGFIGASVIHAILQTVPAIPETWFWYNMCMLFVIACGILAFALHPSLVLKGIVMTALLVFFAADGINVWGGYIVLYFVFFWFGVWIVSRSYGI